MSAADGSRVPSEGINQDGPEGVDPELASSVTKRLSTFQQLPEARVGNVSISEIAVDGFTHNRTSGAIYCVWCNAAVADWQNLNFEAVTQQHSERCPRGPPTRPATVRRRSEDEVEGPPLSYAEVDLSSQTARSTASAQHLRSDNRRMKQQRSCKRCDQAQVETLFLPCRHLVACEACADMVEDCFVCDTKILGTVRIYML